MSEATNAAHETFCKAIRLSLEEASNINVTFSYPLFLVLLEWIERHPEDVDFRFCSLFFTYSRLTLTGHDLSTPPLNWSVGLVSPPRELRVLVSKNFPEAHRQIKKPTPGKVYTRKKLKPIANLQDGPKPLILFRVKEWAAVGGMP